MRVIPRKPVLFSLLVSVLLLGSTAVAHAATPAVGLGTADAFALLAGSTITNTGPSVVTGDLGLHPGTSVTGFPPGTVLGTQHITDATALQAKADLTSAYLDAAGRPLTATLPPDVGGQSLVSGVYRTGSVPSLGLTGTVTLDAQGDPRAVFIFQIESTLVTATDSVVALANGAQACNVYWQVGSSATIGTRTAFKGNILALTSISVNDAAVIGGRLLGRNAAVTLINDTVTRATCAAGTEPTDIGTPDTAGPSTRITGPPGVLGPPGSQICVTTNFTAHIRSRDVAGLRSVAIYVDSRLIKLTRIVNTAIQVNVRGLSVGRHRITVVAIDRAGNRSVKRTYFERCEVALAVPRFTGRVGARSTKS